MTKRRKSKPPLELRCVHSTVSPTFLCSTRTFAILPIPAYTIAEAKQNCPQARTPSGGTSFVTNNLTKRAMHSHFSEMQFSTSPRAYPFHSPNTNSDACRNVPSESYLKSCRFRLLLEVVQARLSKSIQKPLILNLSSTLSIPKIFP